MRERHTIWLLLPKQIYFYFYTEKSQSREPKDRASVWGLRRYCHLGFVVFCGNGWLGMAALRGSSQMESEELPQADFGRKIIRESPGTSPPAKRRGWEKLVAC